MECRIKFVPSGQVVTVAPGTKILAAARRNQVAIRFGCGACRCGTCGIAIQGAENLAPMQDDERELLTRIGLDTGGEIRLACRAKIETGEVTVDIDFQDTYSPESIE
jgi:ferredoxin